MFSTNVQRFVRHARPALAGALTIAGAIACRTTPRAAPRASGDAEREVVATVERLFAGMRTRDTAALRTLLAPELVVVAARETAGGGTAVRGQTVPDFLRAVASGPDELRERIWAPEVRVDGPIATLWAPYDFHRGARFSHCGHDAFHLARSDGRWIVTGLTYTVRTAPCDSAPAGPR